MSTMPAPKGGSPGNKNAGNANPDNAPLPRNTKAGRGNGSQRPEASTASQTSSLNDPCRDEGLDIHDWPECVRENGPTAPEDYAYNSELGMQPATGWSATQAPTAKCASCGRLITEPWWTTLLVPEAVLTRRPLCSSLCLLEYCSTQKWNTGILDIALEHSGESGKVIQGYRKMRRSTISLDVSQEQLRAQLDRAGIKLSDAEVLPWTSFQSPRAGDCHLRTESVLSEPAGRMAKRPHEGISLTRNTKAKSGSPLIGETQVIEATAPKLHFLKAVNAARMGLPTAC